MQRTRLIDLPSIEAATTILKKMADETIKAYIAVSYEVPELNIYYDKGDQIIVIDYTIKGESNLDILVVLLDHDGEEQEVYLGWSEVMFDSIMPKNYTGELNGYQHHSG